jgi:hypothetical protein
MPLDDALFAMHPAFVELDLQSARLEREIEAKIKAELARLPFARRESVLARVVVDASPDAPNGKIAPKVNASSSSEESTQTQWEKIVAYCHGQANPNGKFRTADLTEALLSDKFKEDPGVALSTIYTAVKRRSVGVSKDPYFVWLKKGRFRLATPEERAKAHEGAK